MASAKETVLEQLDTRVVTRSEPLWHYTSAQGVLGILGDNHSKFWATGIEYLNDHKELVYGLDFLQKRIVELRDKISVIEYAPDEPHEIVNIPGKLAFLDSLCKAIGKVMARDYPTLIHCYVTSFSENGDQLSQWRAYGTGTNGFALGVDPTKVPIGPGHPLRPGPQLCSAYYGHESVPQTITDALNDRLGRFMVRTESPTTSDGMMDQQLRWLATLAAQIKHNGFSEEAEWRYINAGYDGPLFRHAGSRLIPYIEWQIPKEAIVAVKVGPGPNQRENRRSIESVLYKFGYNEAAKNVSTSATPFR